MGQTFPDVVLVDGELVLRAFEEADLPGVVEAATDPLTLQWLPLPRPVRPGHGAGTGASLTTSAGPDRGARPGPSHRWQDGQLLGAIDLKDVDWAARVAEIGYWTHPAHRGRGVMTRAVRLLARWALTDQGFERIEVRVALGNLASIRVAEKAGLIREGVARSAGYVHAGRVDLVVFSLIRATSTPDLPQTGAVCSGHARVPSTRHRFAGRVEVGADEPGDQVRRLHLRHVSGLGKHDEPGVRHLPDGPPGRGDRHEQVTSAVQHQGRRLHPVEGGDQSVRRPGQRGGDQTAGRAGQARRRRTSAGPGAPRP